MKSIAARGLVAVIFAASILFATASPSRAAGAWHGVVGGDNPNIRSGPSTADPVVGTLETGQPVDVIAWVEGERVDGVVDTWAELAPGEYVYGNMLGKSKPSAPPAAPQTFSGHWIDVNLTQQVITAYNGDTPVYWAVMSSGAPGWETPAGTFNIRRRVANETMTSNSLAVSVPVPYDLTNVLWTQYFTPYGTALHDNYWKDPATFGVPTSHGCVGMLEPDAHFFWNWAALGTVVNIHS